MSSEIIVRWEQMTTRLIYKVAVMDNCVACRLSVRWAAFRTLERLNDVHNECECVGCAPWDDNPCCCFPYSRDCCPSCGKCDGCCMYSNPCDGTPAIVLESV